MMKSWKNMEQQWRKELLSHARGNVLELGAGMGNNFKYYPPGVTITATDASRKALGAAKVEAKAKGVNTNFIVSAIDQLNLQSNTFDTIVSTFTLSAHAKPVELLRQFRMWCKQDGSILLMDYGLSKHGLVRWVQKKYAPFYYRNSGSHLDGDIAAWISAANLGINRMEIRYAGIVYLAWAFCKPV
jgi:ubiquinone/menaquinone biosynthesis C-methylase UbiE